MEKCFSIDFYLKGDYDRKIDEMAKTLYQGEKMPDSALCQILGLDDPIMSLYLFARLESRIGRFGNCVLIKLKSCMSAFRKIHRYEDSEDLESRILHIVCSKVGEDTEIDAFLECISEMEMQAPALDFVRKNFGYGQIYRYSKDVLNNILGKKYNEREIGYALVLLNHPKLCYKHLLPLLKRINLYIDSMVIEKNIVRACVGLRAIVLYSPDTLKSNGTFVLSLIVFLAKIFYQPSLYTCMECNDLQELLHTMELLATMDADIPEGSSNVLCGILEDAAGRLVCATKDRSSIMEDSLLIYGLTGVCRVACKVLHVKSEDVCRRVTCRLVVCISALRLDKPDYVTLETWFEFTGLFLKEKYGLLEIASRCNTGFCLEMTPLVRDIESSNMCLAVWFGEIDNLYSYFNWRILLESVVSHKIRCHLELLVFVISEKHIGRKNYMAHITKYICFLLQLNCMDVLLLTVIKVCNMIRFFDTREIAAMLVRLFLRKDLLTSDVRILKMKKKIISTALQEGLEAVFLEETFDAVGNEKDECNHHILTFIVIFFYRIEKVSEDAEKRALELVCRASHFPEWNEKSRQDAGLVMRCVALGVILSKYSESAFVFLKKSLHVSKFYLYVVFFMSQLHLRMLDYSSFLECEKDLVEFLFTATNAERLELERLYFFLKEQSRESLENSVFVRTYNALFWS